MKEILVLNLTRMGDLLQTTPLMAGLKEEHPLSKITLLANSAFADICKGIPFIDDLILFDIRGCRERLSQKKYSLVDNFKFFDNLIEKINRKKYDLAINITHSPASAIITSLVRTKEIRGFSMDPEGHRIIKHPWMRYFFTVVPNRDYNPYHLVDIYIKIGGTVPERKGLIFEISGDDEKHVDALLRKEDVSEGDRLIGFQLGASKSDRRWPISYFIALADMIAVAFNVKIVLFGSQAEAGLATEFNVSSNVRTLNLIGKTSPGELSAMLKRCSLLIGNDTGPLHLATAVGTKVIGLFSVNAHFMETGPYGSGHYVVEADLPCSPCGFDVDCKDMVCKHVIKPDAVFEIVKEALGRGQAAYTNKSPVWNSVQVYQSFFKDDGLLDFRPLIRRRVSKEAIYCMLYRRVWEGESRRSNGGAESSDHDICEELSRDYTFDGMHDIITLLRKELTLLERLISLSGEGFNLVGMIAEKTAGGYVHIPQIKDLWKRVESIDLDIELIGQTHPCFRPVIEYFKYAREALEGNELCPLAESSRGIYKDMMKNLSHMMQLMKRLIAFLESKTAVNTCEVTYCK